MASENHDDDPFLAPIYAKIAAWQAVIDSYLAARAGDGPAGENGAIVKGTGTAVGSAGVRGHGTVQLPIGIFRDKPLKEAIPLYLEAGRRKQTNKDIAVGLIAGGFPTTSDNFEATVGTALYRLKTDGVILRFPDGWDVAKSYPDSLRGRLEKDAKPKRLPAKKTAQPRKAKKKTSTPKAVKRTTVARPKKTSNKKPVNDLATAIESYMTVQDPQPVTVQDIGTFAGKPTFVVKLTLGRMAKKGTVVKAGDGRWKLA